MLNIFKYLLVFITLFVFLNVGSAESISGYVFDENSIPLNNVLISDNSTSNTTNTNSTGYYNIDGYTNLTTYIMTATLAGYIDNTLTVNVNGSMINQNITITEKGSLYDMFQLIKEIVDNVTKIIDLVILGITISITVTIGVFILSLIKRVG